MRKHCQQLFTALQWHLLEAEKGLPLGYVYSGGDQEQFLVYQKICIPFVIRDLIA